MQEELNSIIPISKELKLLYVEDNAKTREATLPLLENFFSHVEISDDGAKAYQLYKEKTFDIILTDISIPTLNGIELIEKIRQEDKHISIIVLSAYNDNNYLLQAIRLDVDGYIIKPLMLLQLLSTLQKVVRKQELEKQKQETEMLYKRLGESIKFASAIQHSLITPKENFDLYFKEHFTIWEPRDIVGGDFYFFTSFEDESALLMVLDCTGHGVHGAFLAMLCEVIYRQIVARLKNKPSSMVSPAAILMEFNKTLIDIFNSNSSTTLDTKGFDAQVVYICKRYNKMKYAGAKNPLYYLDKEKVRSLPADNRSVGYNISSEFKFKEHTVDVTKGMKIYLTTDGFWDQLGGFKRLPFGKKRFQEMLQRHHKKPMEKQKELFLEALTSYKKEGKTKRIDDIAFVGVSL